MRKFNEGESVRVFLNALHSKSGGGVTYLSNILPQLAKDNNLKIHVCINQSQIPLFPGLFKYSKKTDLFECLLPNIKTHVVSFQNSFWKTIAYEQFKMPFLIRNVNADVTFSPANYGPLFAPHPILLLRNALSVAFVERRFKKLLYWGFLYIGTVLSVFSATKVIVVSNFAKKASIGKLAKITPGKFYKIGHGVSTRFQPLSFDLRSQTQLLTVSDLYIQKNLHTLLKAVSLVIKKNPLIKLTIVGDPIDDDYSQYLISLVAKLNIEEVVTFAGRMGPDQLCDLYQQCAVFVFPSTVETFGNPLLEALASGAPVACSSAPAMIEVAHDAAIYFDPLNDEEIATVLIKLLSSPDKRKILSDMGVDRAKLFSWRQTAESTAAVFKAAARSK